MILYFYILHYINIVNNTSLALHYIAFSFYIICSSLIPVIQIIYIFCLLRPFLFRHFCTFAHNLMGFSFKKLV